MSKINWFVWLLRAAVTIGLFLLVYNFLHEAPTPDPVVIEKVITKDSIIYRDSLVPVTVKSPTESALEDSLDALRKELQIALNLPPDTFIHRDTIYKTIVLDYFSIRTYDSLLVDNEDLKARVSFDISRNKAKNLVFDYTLYSRETTIIQPPKMRNHLYAGVLFADRPYIGLNYAMKNRVMLGGGLGSQQSMYFQLSYKIW